MKRTGATAFRAAALAVVSAMALAACEKASEVALWPFVDRTQQEQQQAEAPGGPPPPPPLEPVDPLHPVSGPSEGSPSDAPVVENPAANTGAPEGGTPFVEKPVDASIPISDAAPPVSAETGQPITLPPPGEAPSGPSESPQPEAPAAEPAPATPAPDAPAAENPGAPAEPTPAAPAEPAPAPVVPSFYYYAPGSLEPGSGTGSSDATVMAPGIVFPIRSAPAYPQSQVYRFGGGVKGGDQCDPRNFQAPWRDNFCELRSSGSSVFCTRTGAHLGQDIRVGTPEGCKAERSAKAADRTRYEVVAVEDGIISNVGSYSINVRSGGRIYRYLHLNMAKLKVAAGQSVKKGDVIGYVSNDFGGTPTTLHLHFEIKLNTAENGWQYAPPYTSLLAAYQRRENNPGEMVEQTANVAAAPK